jgi:ribonuclease HI
MRLTIHADGASRGNPGPAAIGAVIKDENQRVLASISQYIGETTNNQAEYRAVIAALVEAVKLNAERVTLCLDSELVANQLAGSYKVKNLFLYPLYKEALELCHKLTDLSVVHVGHDGNHEAHLLAQAALDKSGGRKSHI